MTEISQWKKNRALPGKTGGISFRLSFPKAQHTWEFFGIFFGKYRLLLVPCK